MRSLKNDYFWLHIDTENLRENLGEKNMTSSELSKIERGALRCGLEVRTIIY